jgi:hypothetical protein
MVYEEPEALLDTSGDLDWLFEGQGRAVIEDKSVLPLRDDLIIYNPENHLKEFEKNIQWRGCPGELQIVLSTIVHKFFDVFTEEGMQNHIRGFEFNIDTGAVTDLLQATSIRTTQKQSDHGAGRKAGKERHRQRRHRTMGITSSAIIQARPDAHPLGRVHL